MLEGYDVYMNFRCFETEYKNFGKCICIENETIKFMATLEFGPRIIYFGLRDEENILFEDIDRNFYMDVDNYGTWYAYGGHRIWNAPETVPETYIPDNTPVDYSFNEETNTLIMAQQKTPYDKQFSLVCTFNEDSSIIVTNKIKNCSNKAQKFAPWAVTGLAPGGVEYIDLCTENTGFLANRVISLWSYTDLKDKRFEMHNDKIVLRQDIKADTAFKIGLNVTCGEVRYTLRNQTYIKKFEKYNHDYSYPDFSCNYETYTNKHFLECELIGDKREYQPDETASISEIWVIKKEESEFV